MSTRRHVEAPAALPDWAKVNARRAARYRIHPTDDAYKAAQRRVPARQAARRQLIDRFRALGPIVAKLSDIDRQNARTAAAHLEGLFAEWERSALNDPVQKPAGRSRTAADRDVLFHEIVERLVDQDRWDRTAALTALATFIVEEFPPGLHPDNGRPANVHLYGALSSGYNTRSNRTRKTPEQLRTDWNNMPIAERARLAFVGKISNAKAPRNK